MTVPITGNEQDTMLAELERERAIFAWKTGELDAQGLSQGLPPSTMTLGGLVKHVALVEDEYFTHRLLGAPHPQPWDGIDWDATPNWEWETGSTDDPAELYALYAASVTRSREAVASFLETETFDSVARASKASLRRILIDMIAEYARHSGHADLLREAVDGLTGEDPPR